jgi:glycosyltransferase involved in cell wall biosynthesis
MPVRNAEGFLPTALGSVLAQDFSDYELLAVDDGSSDSSCLLLLRLAENNNRVRVFCQKGLGAFAARNLALQHSNGEFIAFLDADDFYPDSSVLGDLYSAARLSGAKICGGSWCKLAGNSLITRFRGNDAGYSFDKDGFVDYRGYQFDFGYQRFIYRRDLLLKYGIGFPPLLRYQDPPFFVRAMLAAGSFYATRRLSYCYRLGHQKILWDLPRANSLIDGLTDVIMLAENNGLDILRELTVCRAQRYIPAALCNNLCPQLLEKIFCLCARLNESQRLRLLAAVASAERRRRHRLAFFVADGLRRAVPRRTRAVLGAMLRPRP